MSSHLRLSRALVVLFVALLAACAQSTPPTSDEAPASASDKESQLLWPISGTVTQNSAPAPGHPGIDIGAVVGTPVYAAADGDVVTPFDDPGGYGCNVVINHTGGGWLGQGTVTIYGHLSGIVVQAGAHVGAGTLIGQSGGAAGAPCSGNASGPHLHFELRADGVSIRGWDTSVHVGSWVTDRTPIDTSIDGLGEVSDCNAACGNYGCQCVDGQCSGGFCPGTGCSAEETADCGNYGANCVDHQCNGGFAPGSGCTARETLDCENFGVDCVDHKCSGGFGDGSGCTARETLDCGHYGVDCVDHKCAGGFGPGSGCTARETLNCQNYGCDCVDHACAGGFCPGTGCTARETLDCENYGCGCAGHACSGGACGG